VRRPVSRRHVSRRACFTAPVKRAGAVPVLSEARGASNVRWLEEADAGMRVQRSGRARWAWAWMTRAMWTWWRLLWADADIRFLEGWDD
jgi:hypothetical protein